MKKKLNKMKKKFFSKSIMENHWKNDDQTMEMKKKLIFL